MSINWKEAGDSSWHKEFKELKGTLSIAEIKLLEQGAQTMKEAWQLGALHAEYKRLKRNQPPKLPTLKKHNET